MRFLLDTNVFEHVANRAHTWQLIEASSEQVGIENCAISAVTAYELRHHIERGPGRVRQENVLRLKVMFAAVPCVSITLKIADAAGRIAAYLESIGQAIGPHDPMIAATAMTRGMICVTDNVKHFARVPDLKLVNWHAPAAQSRRPRGPRWQNSCRLERIRKQRASQGGA